MASSSTLLDASNVNVETLARKSVAENMRHARWSTSIVDLASTVLRFLRVYRQNQDNALIWYRVRPVAKCFAAMIRLGSKIAFCINIFRRVGLFLNFVE